MPACHRCTRGNGPVTYACVIHPEMTGTIVVG
jgi:plastocyanin